jgi:hypothetical protein
LEDKITSGSFYVESNGAKIPLPNDLLDIECFYPNSDSIDYGKDKITHNMPAVPNAPSGRLTIDQKNAVAVTKDNKNSFFKAFRYEFDYSAPRAAIEETGNHEELRHGYESGYYIYKSNGKGQANNTAWHSTSTATTEYFDYSNRGSLYFGGGYGKAELYTNKSDKNSWARTSENKLNGKVNFNGDFKGTLEFNNFLYKEESNESYTGDTWNYDEIYTYISGKVMIGTLDVTNEYVKYILKDENIPKDIVDGNIDAKLVGNWKLKERFEDDWGYCDVYWIFDADGTGKIYYYGYEFSSGSFSEEDPFSWYVKDGTLYTMYYWEYYEYPNEYSVSGNNLILNYEEYGKFTGALPRSTRAVSQEKTLKLKEKLRGKK